MVVAYAAFVWRQSGLVGGCAGTSPLWPGPSHLLALTAISCPPMDLLAFSIFFYFRVLRAEVILYTKHLYIQ